MRIKFVMLLLSIGLFVGSAEAELRSWYEFEGDFSNNITGPDAAPIGNAQIVTDGERGQVLSLDGNGDYLDCGNDSIVNIEHAMTLAVWIKSTDMSGSDGIISYGWAWRMLGDADSIVFKNSTLSVGSLYGNVNVDDGDWHHLAVTYDSVAERLITYVDGDEDTSIACTGLLNVWDGYQFAIGYVLSGTHGYFNGLIDDARVYDHALSPAEIGDLAFGDCNGNGIPDADDIIAGTSLDCNGNGVPDECDIASGASLDCNANGIPDECELSGNDCNANGVPDECDIASGTSLDTNGNGIPDECESQLEAEDATLNGVEAVADSLASGGYRVRLFNTTGDYILYDNVIDTNYLQITYSLDSASNKQCSVYIDSNDVATAIFAPTGAWDVYSSIILNVNVHNSVKLQLDSDDQTANADQSCASQDKINLSSSEPGSVEWVCENQLDRLKNYFAQLNLDYSGLEDVKTAVDSNDWPTACNEIISYYQTCNTYYGSTFREPKPTPTTNTVSAAEDLLNDIFVYAYTPGTIERFPDGSIDWDYRGPVDSIHWANNFCRIYWMTTLINAYLNTGNINYSTRLNKDIADYVVNYPVGAGLYVWDHLNVGIRERTISRIFYKLLNADEFQPATKILMLISMAEHGDFLRYNHVDGGNQMVSELQGLARTAVGYPELADASEWADHVGLKDAEECEIQVYPDGVQYELSFSYHNGVAGAFGDTADELRNGGYTVNSIFDLTVENMYNYMAWALRPNGDSPLNGDTILTNYKDKILSKADVYDRDDWRGMVDYTNYSAYAPTQPSAVFPWAGHAIFRNGWDADAHWSFFDIGPYGAGHVHADKLHISVAAFGRDLIADSGKWHYDNYADPWGYWREYFIGSFSHNNLIFDGFGQKIRSSEVRSTAISSDNYLLTSEFDYARASTTEYDYQGGTHNTINYNLPGTVTHTRAVLYVKDKYWVVVDNVETDRARDIDTLWQFAPDCSVVIDGSDVKTTDSGVGNIRITPVASHTWNVDVVIAEGSPDPDDNTLSWDVLNPDNGWYSVTTRAIEPSYTAIYSAPSVSSSTFSWILTPADGDTPQVNASVISETANDIKIRIQIDQDITIVNVPFNSAAEPSVTSSAGPADFDDSGDVDFIDLTFLTDQWLSDSPQTHPVTGKTPDLEADGTIDFADFAYFAQSWL